MKKKFKSSCLYCKQDFLFGYSSTGKYCSNKCQKSFEASLYLEKLKNGEFVGKQINRTAVYKQLVQQRGNSCEICGITEWNEKPIRLWVDHIDGCALNNHWQNFRLICPNCDSQLDTCRAKNKGKGRGSLGIKVY